MIADLAVELIHATVQIEQPLGDGTRTVGTGFLINAPTLDGQPRTVLVTANHVLQRMPGVQARIGYRIANADGSWSYAPQKFNIRDADGNPSWTQHPKRDVAAIVVSAPPEFAKAAIPKDWLAGDETFSAYAVGAGDQMMALGFPRGLSANPAGFPILRSGRVASFPLAPAAAFPTFLLDFTVFPGNSGGPVFMAEGVRRRPGGGESQEVQFIAGLLTQQVELNSERLEIGIVTHARYIHETLALLDNPLAEITVAQGDMGVGGAKAASALEAISPDY
ncbi:serine protease [Phenylobacterium sp.]|uniref:trypsin-like serine peptidase n=1 Tax=Phenylobacterium sp. TaxID=1871053 RepID=UPI002730B639|nr:serine protease [Phenylobacterium sp.]MDP1873051.1 serine protease [Phenylobacterium sp.]MDP3299170.1 serine protease [Phenylobacterium sp.]MDP3490639.1 serine protease [Phenylobacterium sp.]